MNITKNAYLVTSVYKHRDKKTCVLDKIGTMGGSSLDRVKEESEEAFIKRILNKPLFPEKKKKKRKPKAMSRRTKSKVRRKIIAFSRVNKHLSLLTLTFVNKVDQEKAVKILHRFLDYVRKAKKDFQYLWVAEMQTSNKVFKNNIHFHLITNKYFEREKWRKYWIELQAKHGIKAREEHFKLTHSFDVRKVDTNDIKKLGNYLTAYVTKNNGLFACQTWNCSTKVSQLYTEFYDDMSFLRKVEALEKKKLLGGERKVYVQEYCAVHIIPANRLTMRLYSCLDERNRKIWNRDLEKEVSHGL